MAVVSIRKWWVAFGAVAVVAGIAMTVGHAFAQPEPPARQQTRGRFGPGGGTGGGAGSVEGAMKGMNRALRELKDSIKDESQREANLKQLNELEKNCIAAKALGCPASLLKKAADAEAKAKLKETYNADMIKLMRKLLDVEQSVIDGKWDDAATQLGDVQRMQNEGHKDMGVKEGGGGRGRRGA